MTPHQHTQHLSDVELTQQRIIYLERDIKQCRQRCMGLEAQVKDGNTYIAHQKSELAGQYHLVEQLEAVRDVLADEVRRQEQRCDQLQEANAALQTTLAEYDSKNQALEKAVQEQGDISAYERDHYPSGASDFWREQAEKALNRAASMETTLDQLEQANRVLEKKLVESDTTNEDLRHRLTAAQESMLTDWDTRDMATAQWHQALLVAVQGIAQALTGTAPPAQPSPFRFALEQRVRYEGLPYLVEQQRLTTTLYVAPIVDYLLRPCAPGTETVWVLEAYCSPVEDENNAQ